MFSLFYCLTLVVAGVRAQGLHDFVAGYRMDQIYIPDDCAYRAQRGDRIFIHYNGTLIDGTVFDSSQGRDPYAYRLGFGDVIQGLDWATEGVCVGEKRKMVIPPELGYKNHAKSKIPAGSTLNFEVLVVDIEQSGFRIDVLHVPENCKRRTAPGDTIREHYNGTFLNGTIFDTSYQRGRTYDFVLGEGNVIRGVDMGLMNMCEGERRKITVPALLGYGSGGYRDLIPGGATLVFDAEVIEIVSGKLKWYKIDGPECSTIEQAERGDVVTLSYNGFYDHGYRFSSNGEQRKVRIDDQSLLKGLVDGISGMCIGERRRLKVPPELVIGDLHREELVQGSRLTLDVEIVEIHKTDLFKSIDKNGDKYLCEQEVKFFLENAGEFHDRMQIEEKASLLIEFHFNNRDVNKDGWVNRNEFYGLPDRSHDEL